MLKQTRLVLFYGLTVNPNASLLASLFENDDLIPQYWLRHHRIKRIKPTPSPTGTIGERRGSDLSQNGGA